MTPHTYSTYWWRPFGKGNNNYIKNVLHVPTITKNLVSISQIVEQGIQFRFNNRCFIKKDGRLIAKGQRDDWMSILDPNEVKSAIYAKGLKTETKVELWDKRIDHINLQRLWAMQSKGVVIGLWVETSRLSVWSMPTWQTKSTLIPKGELHKQRLPRRHTLGCMGTTSNTDDRRMPVPCHLPRWLIPLHVDLPDEEEERCTLPLSKAQGPSGEINGLAHSIPMSGWRKGVLLQRIHLLPRRWRKIGKYSS